jgi:colanic acid/amylovoran biosynthesis protein
MTQRAPHSDLRSIKIGLLWHSARSGNLGVGALTIANMALVRKVAADLGLVPEFLILGVADTGEPYLNADEAKVFDFTTRSILSPSGSWRAIGAQDCVLDIGAGDSFADIYRPRRFAFLWLSKMVVLACRKPLLLSPQTIGPFTRFPYRELARLALVPSFAVMVRDRMSLDALTELAPAARGVLSIDVAFALPYEDRSAERGGDRVRVGVNVSGLLFNEAQSGRNRFGLQVDYVALMRRFIRGLADRPDVETHLITHVVDPTGGLEDDGSVADRLAEEFPRAIRAPNFSDPRAAKSYISSLDFLVGGRMHACIAAFSAGVPVVPIAYSRKFSGLFAMVDYPWLVPVTGIGTDEALAYLNDCLDRRAELARDIAAGTTRVEALLDAYRVELRRFFTAAVGAT